MIWLFNRVQNIVGKRECCFNFKFDENGRKFSKYVENTGKRRNCSLQAMAPFPTVLSKDVYCRHIKTRGRFGKIYPFFTCLQYKSFENTVGKGEIACNEQFLLFSQCFLPMWRTFRHFHQIWICRLQPLSVSKCLKFVVWERFNLHETILSFNDSEKESFWKHFGNQHFSFFYIVFSSLGLEAFYKGLFNKNWGYQPYSPLHWEIGGKLSVCFVCLHKFNMDNTHPPIPL